MAPTGKRRRWLVLAYTVQLVVLFIVNYNFNDRVDMSLRELALSLQQGGIAAEQVHTASLALSSIRRSISFYILSAGLIIILANFVTFILLPEKSEEK